MTVAIEVRGLSVERGGRTVLRGVDLELRAGEALALVGPNAAGKSTLLRALVGLLPAAQGEVRVEGRPIGGWSRAAVARRVALVAAEDDGQHDHRDHEDGRSGDSDNHGPSRVVEQHQG